GHGDPGAAQPRRSGTRCARARPGRPGGGAGAVPHRPSAARARRLAGAPPHGNGLRYPPHRRAAPRDLPRGGRGGRRARGGWVMRIAYVCADAGVPVFGCKGSSVHVQEMIRAFQRQGARVDLFAARVGERPPPDFDALSMHRLPAIRDGEPAGHAAAVTALNHEVAAAIERAGPYDLVYERYSLWSFAAMEQARAAGISGLLEVNAPLIEEQAVHRGLRDAGGAALVAARVFQAATGLVVVGGGPEDAAIRAELAARGLTNAAVLTGVVAPGEVPGLLTSMDAAVAPYPDSKRFYFSPLKVYEYMAAGRAVVASRVGQLEAVIQHEINGLLCSPADPGALATALSRLRREPELRDRLGRAARATVLQGHTWDAVAAKVLALATHDPVAA